MKPCLKERIKLTLESVVPLDCPSAVFVYQFHFFVLHNFLVPVFQVKRGVPVGFYFFALAVDLPPSVHLCEPLVKVFLELVLVVFVVFHNLLTASSIP